MFQSKHIVREDNGFVTSSLMISYQILRATELAGVHNVQELEDTSGTLLNQHQQKVHQQKCVTTSN
jgi:hypothetical protein